MSSSDDYLTDVIRLLLERARDATARRKTARASNDSRVAAFEEGRALGYYEVLSTMVGNLDAYRISRESVGVPPTLDLDRELL